MSYKGRAAGNAGVPLHMLGLHPTVHLCCTPAGSTRLRTLRRPDSSHSAGLVTISVNKSDNPLSYVAQSMMATKTAVNSANLKNGRDEHGVGVGKAEEGGLGIRGLLEVADSPNHSRVLCRSVVETQLKFWVRMLQRTKGIFLNAVSI